jgi:hypothetical protein
MKRMGILCHRVGRTPGISIRIASLALAAAVAAVAGGCSSSAGLPNARPDAGASGAPDVAPDKGASPDVAPDLAAEVAPDLAPDEGHEVGASEAGGTDSHDGGSVDCHLAIDASLPFICILRFDDPSWRNGICGSPDPFGPAVIERLCGGFQSRTIDFGTHRWTCYYDPTTLVLVGGEFSDDVPHYCNNTTYYETAGDVPVIGCNNPLAQGTACGSDGGGQ